MNYRKRNGIAMLESFALLASKFDNFYIPLNTEGDIDFVAVKFGEKNEYYGIRVITASKKMENGTYRASIVGSKRTNENKGKETFNQDSCDFLFVWTDAGKYLIPSSVVTQKISIYLSDDWDRFLVDY